MEKIKSWISEYWIVLLFILAKLMAHILTATNYGFQRDAYLYMAQARHLDWGETWQESKGRFIRDQND